MIASLETSVLEGRERERHVSRAMMRRITEHLKKGRLGDLAPSALEVDPAIYTDPIRFEAEKREIFRKKPILACWSCDIPNPGDIHLFDAAGPSIIIMRGEDHKVRAFLNSCSHRMAEVVRDCSPRNRLVCPFHGWIYDLNGALLNVPGEKECFPGIDKSKLGLVPVPAAEWEGLIFVKAHAGSEAIDIGAYLDPLAPELRQLNLAGCTPIAKARVDVCANWKIALDTYFEGYHFAALHPTTFGPTMISNMQLRDNFGAHERIVAVQRRYLELLDKPEEQWPDHYYEGTHLLFPNTIFFTSQLNPSKPTHTTRRPIFGVWRMFPGARVGEAFTLMETYRGAEIPEDEWGEYQATHDFIVSTVRDEDYSVCAGAQRAMEESPPGRKILFGRNEPALQAIERSIARAAGMPID